MAGSAKIALVAHDSWWRLRCTRVEYSVWYAWPRRSYNGGEIKTGIKRVTMPLYCPELSAWLLYRATQALVHRQAGVTEWALQGTSPRNIPSTVVKDM
jgi:hypothetical protein